MTNARERYHSHTRRTVEEARQMRRGRSRANRFGGRICNRCEYPTSTYRMRLHVMTCWEG